jgi:hypothetical protein
MGIPLSQTPPTCCVVMEAQGAGKYSQQASSAAGRFSNFSKDLVCDKKKISNIVQRMSIVEAAWQRKYFIIRYSLLDIRYFLYTHGKFIILELTTVEELRGEFVLFLHE